MFVFLATLDVGFQSCLSNSLSLQTLAHTNKHNHTKHTVHTEDTVLLVIRDYYVLT